MRCNRMTLTVKHYSNSSDPQQSGSVSHAVAAKVHVEHCQNCITNSGGGAVDCRDKKGKQARQIRLNFANVCMSVCWFVVLPR